jgi:hypothetical protein
MYTSYIGQKFLQIFNQRTNNNYSGAEFFDRVMFPLFFNDIRHLMHVSNSPFFQTPSATELKKSGLSKSEFQYERLKEKISMASDNSSANADASFYVGFAANGPDQTTAGQVTNLRWRITSDELYASWIGNALSIRVEGSQCLLIDSEQVLWHLYQGWDKYRKCIQPVAHMEGRQIETWNGYWLASGDDNGVISPPVKGNRLETYPWIGVIAKLLQWHPGEILPVYIFSLGQTNTTYGFINIHLPQIRRLIEARHIVKKSILSLTSEDDRSFWNQYATDFSLRDACQLGEIGLQALRPRDYARLMEQKIARFNEKNESTLLNIKTWILAMLNNKSDLQQLAANFAHELVAAEATGSGRERGKTSDSADTKAIFESKGLTGFVTSLTEFLEKRTSSADVCRAVVDQSVRIPGELFPLFKALLRFEYVFLKSKK